MKDDLILIDVLGSKIFLVKDDKGLSSDLLGVHGTHRIKEDAAVKEVMANLKPDDICIDIGANFGYYALLEARLCPKGMIYAIEPIKSTIEIFNKSIKINNYKNIKTYQLAIGDKTENTVMKKSKYSNLGTLSKIPPRHYDNDIDIYKMTLKDFCEKEQIERINYIRMDVEGYETEIIKGMKGIDDIMPKGAILNIEVHPGTICSGYLLPKFKNAKKAKEEFYRLRAKKQINTLPPVKEFFDNINDLGFKPFKYTPARDAIADITDMNLLRNKFGIEYCSHLFFEKV